MTVDENDVLESVRTSLQEPLLLLPAADETATNVTPPPASSGSSALHDGLPLEQSILVKALFFLDALGASTWGRFSAIYYNIHGLNSQHIGLIEGLRTAIPTLSMVMWGVVSDRYRCRKRVWVFTKSASTVVLMLLALPFVYSSFLRILIVSVLAQLFVSSGILDAYTLELLGSENKMYYGRYRLYASLSWGVGSIIMGWVTDHYGFDFNFIMLGVLSAMMIGLVATKIPETSLPHEMDDPEEERHDAHDDNESHIRRQSAGSIMELVSLALRPRVTVFLLEVLVMGAGMATVERLLFLYMVNDLDASTLLCGLSVGVNVLFELPIFWYASPIMKAMGHDGMFLLSMVCFVVRVYGYTWLTPTTKWCILLLESMHGVTFATFWIVTTDVSKVLVERTQGAFWSTAIPMSVQMLYSAVGVSLGSVLGGWAMHRYGSREMYTCTAAVVLCMMVFHIIGSILARTCSSAGSFLPDFPHTTNDDHENLLQEGHVERTALGVGVVSDGDDYEDDDSERLHLTSTDIIQRGGLIEREEREIPRHHSTSSMKSKNPVTLLTFWLTAQSVSTVSGLTLSFGSFQRRNSLSNLQVSSVASIASVSNHTALEDSNSPVKQKSVKKRKPSVASTSNEAYHWMLPSDKILLEAHDRPSDPAGPKVSRLGFTVRGNPRPLRRHRTARGHMYNPSLKYQTSFQNVVEELLFTKKDSGLMKPIFSEDEHLVMSIIFRMKRPKNHFVSSKPGPDRLKKTAPPQTSTIRTDVDNLTKFVLDSMNEVLYVDDRQIMSIHVTKLLDNDGNCEGSTEVYLRSMVEEDVESILNNSFAMLEKDMKNK
jgi:MFS family permease/Holliday junction resolvase RusA-like endonuclease